MYNWKEIPLKYQWAATDKDGSQYAYKDRPILKLDSFSSGYDNPTIFVGTKKYISNWRLSLEKRPKKIIQYL